MSERTAEQLAERVERGPLSLDDVEAIARALRRCAALEEAAMRIQADNRCVRSALVPRCNGTDSCDPCLNMAALRTALAADAGRG